MVWPRRAPRSVSLILDGDDYDDDEESELVKALPQLTSTIHVGKSKQKKKGRSKDGLDLARISAIAQQVARGQIRLPDLNLDNDTEYECC